MKQRLVLASLAAVVAGVAMFFAGRGCTPAPTVVDRVVTHTVTVPAETLHIPGRPVIVREKLPSPSSIDSAAFAARGDSLRVLRARLDALYDELSQYAWLTATIDTGMIRTARVRLGDRDVLLPVEDGHHIEYDFPPHNAWRIMPREMTIAIPDTLRGSAVTERPWYIDALYAIAGAAATVVASILAK